MLTQVMGDTTVLGVVSARPGMILGGGTFNETELRKAWGDLVADQYLNVREQLKAEVLGKSDELQARMKQLDSVNRSLSTTSEDGNKRLPSHEEMAAEYESQMESEAMTIFFESHMVPIALSGRTPVKVDTKFGEIKIGDELGPSSIPGIAMKLTTAGPTIGTAMENFSGGRGMVLTFVHRGWYAPSVDAPVQAMRKDENERSQTATQTVMANANSPVILNGEASGETSFSVSKGARESSDDMFRVDQVMEVGDVVAADRTMSGIFRKANTAHDPAVVGIVSAKRGDLMESMIAEVDSQLASQFESARMSGDRRVAGRIWEQLQAKFLHTHAPVALSGRVLCKVDAAYGGIEVGNLLVASPTSGHAMRSDNPLPGTVIGKALEPLAAGAGLIRVLVMLR